MGSPPILPLVLFVLTYVGLALGRIPGLALDRTGFAILGAVAFLATGSISVEDAKAAVDAPTIVVLFGMMLLSAQYRQSGLYSLIGGRLARVEDPRRLLLGTIVVTALLSAVLTNDVTCFALTPLLAASLLASRRPPVPYLLALACASNLGSALTPIGNPQNILIAQTLHLPFLPFVLACAVPVALSLGMLYLFMARRLARDGNGPAEPAAAVEEPVPLHRPEAAKAVALTVAAIALFLSPVPAPLTALGVAGVVLTSRRMHTRDMLGLVDWHLLALFVGLFIVGRGFEASGWTEAARSALAGAGADLSHPAVLVLAVSLLGLLVGNVPAVMLFLPFVGRQPATGYAMALSSTFAGNAVLVGSIANLIVAEQAGRLDIRLGFREHVGVGLPVTLVSLAFAAGAMLLW
ncbi:MAG TPA: SLC13 family permease [Thermoanaerobaculia bacterium]|jgi:Na+/H+ antiporter NhaD/arsenite permease-like protein|nr:SLC13 family permease [Thermoanaerobaculia bacterium]